MSFGLSAWKKPVQWLWKTFAPDKVYLSRAFRKTFGRRISLSNPQTFNEKILWRMLYDRNPLHTELADKYLVRNHIRTVIGEEYLTPLLGVYKKAGDIDFDAPSPTGSFSNVITIPGSLVLCRDKSQLDVGSVVRHLDATLRKNYYRSHREYHYKNISPVILCEPYLESAGRPVDDCRVYIFEGRKEGFVVLEEDTHGEHRRGLYDEQFNFLHVRRGGYDFPLNATRPKHLAKMFELSRILGKGFGFVRVDWREHQDKLYFGEMTFTPAAGLARYEPASWDDYWGSLWDLQTRPLP